MYTFSQGKLKAVTNKQFSNLKNNYEITFDVNSDIRPCEDGHDIKVDSYDFVKISSISNIEPNSIVDVLAMVKSTSEVQTVRSEKLNADLQKRDLILFDDSGAEIRLTLWGGKAVDPAVNFDDENLIIALKGAKVGDFQGRTLTTVASTSVVYNPPQGLELYNWACRFGDGGAKSLQTICLSGGG